MSPDQEDEMVLDALYKYIGASPNIKISALPSQDAFGSQESHHGAILFHTGGIRAIVRPRESGNR